jgi:hypothetical protein
VRCAAPATYAAALEWGAAGDAGAGASPQSLALVVSGAGTSLAPNSGAVSTLAGSGGCASVDGVGSAASFCTPFGVAVVPSSGAIVVGELGGNRIRVVSPSGNVTTLAGGAAQGFADGSGTAAQFNAPMGVAVMSPSGTVVVADYNNGRVRLVSPAGVVTTLAGGGSSSADGAVGTNVGFWGPYGVAVVPSTGSVVVALNNANCVRLITYPQGVASNLAGCASWGFADGLGTNALFHCPNGVAVVASSGISTAA